MLRVVGSLFLSPATATHFRMTLINVSSYN